MNNATERLKRINNLARQLQDLTGELMPPSEKNGAPIPLSEINLTGTLPDQVLLFEKGLIISALIQTGGSQVRAARMLGIKTTTLNAKIKRYGIPVGQAASLYLENLIR